MHQYQKYIDDVISGRIVACKYVRQACERHLLDLDTGKDRGLYFDEKEADRHINFFKTLRHTKGAWAGKRYQLSLYQEFLIAMVDGWKKDDGLRRFREVYHSIARKNGKSEVAAGFAAKSAILDREEGAEIYFAATKKDQAQVGWDYCRILFKYLAKDSPTIANMVKPWARSITIPDTETKIEYCSSDYDTMDGMNPHFASIDEYHAHKTTGVKDIMQTGMGARPQPLLFTTTTAGFNVQSPCYKFERVCKDILAGVKDDDSLFSLIYTLDEEDDWNDESVWIKANPNLGQSIYIDYLRSQYKRAQNEGGIQEIQFKTKNLNIWTTSFATWLADEKWMKCGKGFDIESLRGRKCYGGLDLASVEDLCAFVLVFPGETEDEPAKVLAWHWCSEYAANFRTKNDGVNYLDWGARGLLKITPGNTTDYAYIQQAVLECFEKYNIQTIGYDLYNSSHLITQLQDAGIINLHVFGQGFISMNPAVKYLKRLVLKEKIDHNNHEMLRWQLGNITAKIDPAGNVKFDKEKSKEKIDGMVALAMAVGEMQIYESKVSVYETRGVRSL